MDPAWLQGLARNLRADAFALQEAEREHWDALREVLPHGRFHEGARATGMGFAAREPVDASFLPMSWRPAPRLRLAPEDWPELGAPLEMLGVHIAAPHTYTPPGYGFWLRRKQVLELEAHLGSAAEDDSRLLLIGDFNATPWWPLYQRVSRWLTDAAVAVAQRQGRGVEPTWGPLWRGRRLLRIDHAFTRGVDAVDIHVAPLAGSDHSALVVDLAV